MTKTSESTPHWTLRVIVSGRVQGVFFRESTRREASALGLAGWVRNLSDGRVEAVFTGPRERCERINLGYLDPATIEVEAWRREKETLVVPRAGELLYRLGAPGRS